MVANTAKPWQKTGGKRRLMLLVLVLVPTIYAGAYMATVLPNRGAPWLEAVVATRRSFYRPAEQGCFA
jgi:membrane glycosyltransferase